MGWVHPWVGSGQRFLIFGGLGWVGLGGDLTA